MSYRGMQLGAVLSTSHVANSFMGTGLGPDAISAAEEALAPPPTLPNEAGPDPGATPGCAGDATEAPMEKSMGGAPAAVAWCGWFAAAAAAGSAATAVPPAAIAIVEDHLASSLVLVPAVAVCLMTLSLMFVVLTECLGWFPPPLLVSDLTPSCPL